MQLVLGHCGVSRNEACDAKSEKASDLSQLTDTWSTGIVALAERIIRARQLKPEARRSAVRGDWEPTRTDPTLTRGEEAALARLRSGVSHTIRMAATTTAARHPTHMLLVRLGCRTADTQRTLHGSAASSRWTHPATIRRPADCPVCGRHCSYRTGVVTHMVDAQGTTRPQELREFNFPDESEPPEIPPEPTPAT
ncbi:hypothetical protein C3747_61g72 [Trypanosoma cruzi]|uniref:Uncharacterized protein n=1 Tax=Trypanosoma cruzi TaxID=5693 RepID=A0A2V2WXP7_TRYCR|nr:hypothetical protein C3747_61g72 [Trypanosoma cruzi]